MLEEGFVWRTGGTLIKLWRCTAKKLCGLNLNEWDYATQHRFLLKVIAGFRRELAASVNFMSARKPGVYCIAFD